MKSAPSAAGHPAPAQEAPNVVRRKFVVAATLIGVAICILFLLNLAYLYGSVYHEAARYEAFQILLVDFDGGLVGQSLLQAYKQLQGPSFPTFDVQNTTQYPTPDSLIEAVIDRQYWAAIYSNVGASKNLSAALQGGTAAASYNANDALTYIWNEVRYPAVQDSVIQSSLVELVAATQVAYHHINGSQALASLPRNAQAAVQVLLNPIGATNLNLWPMVQGSKVFYNTVSMAMPIIQQFFFILALNGISARLAIFERFPSRVSGLLRLIISFVYTFFASLVMTGYIWAFRESWAESGNQFGLTLLLLWFLMHIYFCLIDFAVAFLPPPTMPFVVLTVIFINITSTNVPFELNPGFFRLGYALPAFEAYSVLIDIWSGATAKLYIALPILFSWWVASLVLVFLAHRRRMGLVAKGKEALATEDSFANEGHGLTTTADLEKQEDARHLGAGSEAGGTSEEFHNASESISAGDVKEAFNEEPTATGHEVGPYPSEKSPTAEGELQAVVDTDTGPTRSTVDKEAGR